MHMIKLVLKLKLCDNLDNIYNKYYRDKDSSFHYCDNSKFLDTTVHYTKHACISIHGYFGKVKIYKVCILLKDHFYRDIIVIKIIL